MAASIFIYFVVAFWTSVVSFIMVEDICLRRGVFWPLYLIGWIVRNAKKAFREAYNGK